MTKPRTTTFADDPDRQRRGVEAAKQANTSRLVALEDMAQLATEKPTEFVRKLFEAQAMIVYDLQRKAIKTGRIEDRRFFMEAIRECRNLAAEVAKILEAEGADARADGFLEEVEARLAAASPRLEAARRPVPIADPA